MLTATILWDIVKFPVWAVQVHEYGYCDNSDPEEIETYKNWVNEIREAIKKEFPGKVHIFMNFEGEPYFSHSPEFGLASMCMDLKISVRQEVVIKFEEF